MIECEACRSPEAPDGLDRVECFANTLDEELGRDRFAGPDGLTSWLQEHAALPGGVDVADADVDLARRVRGALRDQMDAQTHGADQRGTVGRLDQLAGELRLVVGFTSEGPVHRSASEGVARPLGDLLGVVATAMENGSWGRMKLCLEDTCRFAYYDQSRNRSGRWCSMAVCGNRAKARAYRARQSRDDGD